MKRENGQSLLELAILGALLLSLLGVLVNYGLRYNFQQQIMQQTFRKALGLASAGGPSAGQASYVFIKDRHIPSPSTPFGVGSFIPTASSASVIRSYTLQEVADTEDELPQVTFNIPTCASDSCQEQLFPYKTAGFMEICVPDDSGGAMKKYAEIYGANNVWEDESVSCSSGTGIKVIDSCEGEILSYDGCKRQCKMITDTNVCIRECQRGRLDESSGQDSCSQICSASIEVPWYCEKLDQLFNFAIAYNKPKIMGVQQDYTQSTLMDNTLTKRESAASISTTDTLNWSNTSKRIIIFRTYTDTSGNIADPPKEVRSIVSQNETETWQTNW